MNWLDVCLSSHRAGWVGLSTQCDEWGWDKGGMYQTQSIPFLGRTQVTAGAAWWALLRKLLGGQSSLALDFWDGRRRGEGPLCKGLIQH